MKTFFRIITFLILLIYMGSCSLTRSVRENQQIVARNSIKITDNKKLSKVDLEEYIVQPQTPKALAFFYYNLWIYNTYQNKRDNGFNRWIMKVFGDAPIIWNQTDTKKSEADIKSFLHNNGYFNTKVFSHIEHKPNKAFVTYNIAPGTVYTIGKIEYDFVDTTLIHIDISKGSLLNIGDDFNTYTIDDERTRISEALRNQGYFEFNPEYVNYIVDSALNNHQINIITKINPPLSAGSDTLTSHFKRYKIDDVFIYTDYETDQNLNQPYDTLVIDLATTKKAKAIGTYHFLYKNKLRVNPNVIAQSVFIEPDEDFNSRDLKETYQKLNRFPTFKYIDINYKKTKDSIQDELDTHIKLYRSKLQYYTLETDGTNSSGDLGVRLGVHYGNKSLFKGGELLSLRLTTAFENRKYTGYENTSKFLFFNTLEYGIVLSIYSPSFIVPIKQSRFPKYFKPQTVIRFGYNYQLRPSYKRHLTNFQFGYEWKQKKFVFHRLTALDVSVIKVYPSDEFQAALDTVDNLRYKDQYKDHFIAALKYNFIYNTQELRKYKSFKFFNARFEAAGNLSYGLSELFDAKKTNGYYTAFGIRYAQYMKLEFDYRHYIALTNQQGIIYRFNTGLGLPYGNSLALPFEKGFYGGGANGMRAWAYRDLGPGVYKNPYGPSYDKMGDIKIEANIEYRFPLYSYLKGAAFVDMGNIWQLYKSDAFEGGEFSFDSFYKQFAVDAGFGFRLDLDFFIIRLDGAAKFIDPAKDQGERFVLPNAHISDIYWSFGIGYPF